MLLETILPDLRVGLRVLIKERSFCALAITVLALGICSVPTMFSDENGTMIRGLGVPNSERLMSVTFIDPSTANAFGVNSQVNALDYEEFLPEQKSFELMVAYINGSTVNLSIDGAPSRITGAYVTPDFLKAIGLAPAMGRDFTPADNQPGAGKVAIMSHKVWQREFAGDPKILGRTMTMNGKPATIIGVMQPNFAFPNNDEIWSPLYKEFPPQRRNDPQNNPPNVLGLLRRDVSEDQANLEVPRCSPSASPRPTPTRTSCSPPPRCSRYCARSRAISSAASSSPCWASASASCSSPASTS